MKKTKLLSVCTMCFLLSLIVACGKKTVAEIELNNDLDDIVNVYGEKDFFEPVAGKYPIIENDGKLEITLEFEISKKVSSTNYTAREFIFLPEDKNEYKIKYNEKRIEFQAVDKQNITKQLLNASIGDHVNVTFVYTPDNGEAKKAVTENISTCRVRLKLDEYEEDVTTTNTLSSMADDDEDMDLDDDDDEVASSGSNEDWDAVLDEYEKYVDSYVKLSKKAMNGDMSAVNEYPSMLEKAERLSDKLENASSDLTAKQVARMNKINQKMMNAL